jgi:hypothetical protein
MYAKGRPAEKPDGLFLINAFAVFALDYPFYQSLPACVKMTQGFH